MNTNQIREFITSMTPVILQAGELAIKSQGKVANIGKKIDIDDAVSERIKKRNRAKTEIDEKVQEILLLAVKDIVGTDNISIDAEEDTPSKKLFSNTHASLTVVIDPIDGTLEYVSEGDRYSINIGLIENNRVLTTLIYFPKSGHLFFIDENRTSYEVIYNNELQIVSKKELKPPAKVNSGIAYTNNRVSSEIIDEMKRSGLTVVEDDGKVLWPDAILKCISGEYVASIFHSPQIRDVLLGGLLETIPGGYAVDWEGNTIVWPNGGRIPHVIFGFGTLQENFLKCLKDHK